MNFHQTPSGPVPLTADEEADFAQREQQAIAAAARNAILRQIAALEATVTARRVRESILTEAGAAWLADVDQQIAALRAQLV